MDKGQQQLVHQVQILLDRLERLSADSIWAHKASGVRGALIRGLNDLEEGKLDQRMLTDLISYSFEILTKAAAEIPDDDIL